MELKCYRLFKPKFSKVKTSFLLKSCSMRLLLYHNLGLDSGPNFWWQYKTGNELPYYKQVGS